GVVDHGDDGQDVAVPRDEIRHRIQVAGLRAAAPEVTIFQVSGCDLECVSNPLSRRKAGPAMRSPGRGMRTPIHKDRPAERTNELDVVHLHVSRQWILFLENARTAETAPLMRSRMWAA